VAEAAGGIGERRGDRVQAVEPDGTPRGLGAALVLARAIVALKVVAGPVVERLALRPWSLVALALGTLRSGLSALALAGLVGTLLAIVGLAVVALRTARSAGSWWATAAAMTVGVWRLHRPSV
jgi:hypothetical protein